MRYSLYSAPCRWSSHRSRVTSACESDRRGQGPFCHCGARSERKSETVPDMRLDGSRFRSHLCRLRRGATDRRPSRCLAGVDPESRRAGGGCRRQSSREAENCRGYGGVAGPSKSYSLTSRPGQECLRSFDVSLRKQPTSQLGISESFATVQLNLCVRITYLYSGRPVITFLSMEPHFLCNILF